MKATPFVHLACMDTCPVFLARECQKPYQAGLSGGRVRSFPTTPLALSLSVMSLKPLFHKAISPKDVP